MATRRRLTSERSWQAIKKRAEHRYPRFHSADPELLRYRVAFERLLGFLTAAAEATIWPKWAQSTGADAARYAFIAVLDQVVADGWSARGWDANDILRGADLRDVNATLRRKLISAEERFWRSVRRGPRVPNARAIVKAFPPKLRWPWLVRWLDAMFEVHASAALYRGRADAEFGATPSRRKAHPSGPRRRRPSRLGPGSKRDLGGHERVLRDVGWFIERALGAKAAGMARRDGVSRQVVEAGEHRAELLLNVAGAPLNFSFSLLHKP